MAENKTTKKSLQKGIAQLQTEIGRTSRRLDDQQLQLSSLQRQLDRAGLAQSPATDVAALKQAQQALAGRLEALAVQSRAGSAQQSRASEAITGLGERADALEHWAAEGAVKYEELLQRAIRLDDRVQALPLLEGRMESLQAHVDGLFDDATRPADVPAQALEALQARTGQLEAQLASVSALQDELELQTALLSREAEQGQVPPQPDDLPFDDRASSPPGENGPGGELASPGSDLEQQLDELLSRAGKNDATSSDLLQRVGILEASNDSLARANSRMITQLEALQQQTAALAEAVEKPRADGRVEVLDQGLRKEQARISGLEQAGASLSQQLKEVLGTTQAIDGRIDALNGESDQLRKQLARLSSELQQTAGEVRHHEHRLQAQESRSEQQQIVLDDTLAGQRRATNELGDKVSYLTDSQQSLKDGVSSLGVQQARHGSDTDELTQRLRRRSIGFALLLGLAAVALGTLWFRAPGMPGGQDAQQLQAALDQRLETVASSIDDRVGQAGDKLLSLDKRVGEAERSLDDVGANKVPRLQADLEELSSAVETLQITVQQQRQGQEALQSSQADLLGALADVRQRLDKAVEPEPVGSQQPADAEVPVVAESTSRDPAAESAADSTAVATPTAPADPWKAAQAARRYTLQIAGFRRTASLEWFLQRQNLDAELAVHRAERDGQPWYVLLYGIYDTSGQAAAAKRQLPARLAAQRPWVRRIPASGDLNAR